MLKFSLFGYDMSSRVSSDFWREVLNSNVYNQRWIACLNPHSIVVAARDNRFNEALLAADINIPDGIGVCFASALILGKKINRYTGADLLEDFVISIEMNRRETTVFLLGASEETLINLKNIIELRSNYIKVIGTYSPPFEEKHSFEQLDAMARAVECVRPDALLVGMTAPKQEIALNYISKNAQFKVGLAIGGVFDFATGNVKRIKYPVFGTYFEWLIRLFQEPRRLWRRTFISTPVFAYMTFKEFFRAKCKT